MGNMPSPSSAGTLFSQRLQQATAATGKHVYAIGETSQSQSMEALSAAQERIAQLEAELAAKVEAMKQATSEPDSNAEDAKGETEEEDESDAEESVDDEEAAEAAEMAKLAMAAMDAVDSSDGQVGATSSEEDESYLSWAYRRLSDYAPMGNYLYPSEEDVSENGPSTPETSSFTNLYGLLSPASEESTPAPAASQDGTRVSEALNDFGVQIPRRGALKPPSRTTTGEASYVGPMIDDIAEAASRAAESVRAHWYSTDTVLPRQLQAFFTDQPTLSEVVNHYAGDVGWGYYEYFIDMHSFAGVTPEEEARRKTATNTDPAFGSEGFAPSEVASVPAMEWLEAQIARVESENSSDDEKRGSDIKSEQIRAETALAEAAQKAAETAAAATRAAENAALAAVAAEKLAAEEAAEREAAPAAAPLFEVYSSVEEAEKAAAEEREKDDAQQHEAHEAAEPADTSTSPFSSSVYSLVASLSLSSPAGFPEVDVKEKATEATARAMARAEAETARIERENNNEPESLFGTSLTESISSLMVFSSVELEQQESLAEANNEKQVNWRIAEGGAGQAESGKDKAAALRTEPKDALYGLTSDDSDTTRFRRFVLNDRQGPVCDSSTSRSDDSDAEMPLPSAQTVAPLRRDVQSSTSSRKQVVRRVSSSRYGITPPVGQRSTDDREQVSTESQHEQQPQKSRNACGEATRAPKAFAAKVTRVAWEVAEMKKTHALADSARIKKARAEMQEYNKIIVQAAIAAKEAMEAARVLRVAATEEASVAAALAEDAVTASAFREQVEQRASAVASGSAAAAKPLALEAAAAKLAAEAAAVKAASAKIRAQSAAEVAHNSAVRARATYRRHESVVITSRAAARATADASRIAKQNETRAEEMKMAEISALSSSTTRAASSFSL
jgi:hypothetical protein